MGKKTTRKCAKTGGSAAQNSTGAVSQSPISSSEQAREQADQHPQGVPLNGTDATHKFSNYHKPGHEGLSEMYANRRIHEFYHGIQRVNYGDVIKSEQHFQTRKGVDLQWWFFFVLTIAVSVVTRMYRIEWPAHICWDETHFGKMGSWYIKGIFFFDVHPPLGKMLIGLAGTLTGYDGEFSFSKPGIEYGDIQYVGMRVFCSSLGATLAPLSFLIVWELTRSLTAATITSSLIIFDTGLLTLCQYILLDPPLLFFIMVATYCLTKFNNESDGPFLRDWWLWLTLTGIFLACSIGVKFVGLFVILFAGITTISDLWRILGDLSLSMVTVVNHLVARAACLIVLPITVYLWFYAIHFEVLPFSGSGDGFFSSAFQSQLKGNALYNANMPAEVAYGSVISIKNYRTAGGYLHSHTHLYPENVGARQQQVTTYGHKDDNNHWIIKKVNKPANRTEEPELVMNGDLVRLEHVNTGRNLHSHRHQAPISKKHFQVTCYGNQGVGDYNDHFRLEIKGASGHAPLFTVRSTFRLVHNNLGCAVQSHSKQLPKWGWDQNEVTCNPNTRDRQALWNVEQVTDPRLPNRSFSVYSPSFLEKVFESHAVMLQSNSGLKPKEGEVTSRPWQWPINYRGQPFSGGQKRVYLLGNPVLWWGNLVVTAAFLIISSVRTFCRQRGIYFSPVSEYKADIMLGAGWWLLLGWLLHYLPFWAMGRVLYFHHYFPSLLFSFMLTGVTLDYIISCLQSMAGPRYGWVVYHVLLGAIYSTIIYSFYLFSPMSYGMTGPLAVEEDSNMHGLRWLDSWDI